MVITVRHEHPRGRERRYEAVRLRLPGLWPMPNPGKGRDSKHRANSWLCLAGMLMSVGLLVGHMADYAAKLVLMVCLFGDPDLRLHFMALVTAHIVSSMHRAYALCRSVAGMPRATVVPAVLVLGIATPLLQVAHLSDALAAAFASQDLGCRLPLRSAPLDIVFEGLVFLLASLHLRIRLGLGYSDPPPSFYFPHVSFEVILAFALITSLTCVSVALVHWDSTLSLKLSRDLYGPSRRQSFQGSLRSVAIFAGHLLYRGSEVAGKSALVASLAFIWRPGCFAGYMATSYVLNLMMLLCSSAQEAVFARSFGAAAVVALPLLFANMPQFVDSPKHAVAASNVAGCIRSLRALEV